MRCNMYLCKHVTFTMHRRTKLFDGIINHMLQLKPHINFLDGIFRTMTLLNRGEQHLS